MASQDQQVAFTQQGVQNIGRIAQALSGGIGAPNISAGSIGLMLGTAGSTAFTLSTSQQVTFFSATINSASNAYFWPSVDVNGAVNDASILVYQVVPGSYLSMVLSSGSWLMSADVTGTIVSIGFSLGL